MKLMEKKKKKNLNHDGVMAKNGLGVLSLYLALLGDWYRFFFGTFFLVERENRLSGIIWHKNKKRNLSIS